MSADPPPTSPVPTDDAVAAAQLPPPPSNRPPRLPPPSRRPSLLESSNFSTDQSRLFDASDEFDLESVHPAGTRRISLDPPLPPTPHRHRTPVAPPQGRAAVTASTKRKDPTDKRSASRDVYKEKRRKNTTTVPVSKKSGGPQQTTGDSCVRGESSILIDEPPKPQKTTGKSAPKHQKPSSNPATNCAALIHNGFIDFIRFI